SDIFPVFAAMAEEHLRTLIDLGLPENEGRVYLAALNSGPASVQRLAKLSGVKRTTVYTLLESLIRRTLIHEELRGFKRVFVAEHPKSLEAILDARRLALQSSLPELIALFNLKSGEDTIRFYDGLEATKQVYEGLLEDIRPGEDYLVLSALNPW